MGVGIEKVNLVSGFALVFFSILQISTYLYFTNLVLKFNMMVWTELSVRPSPAIGQNSSFLREILKNQDMESSKIL